ncbi:unnamed protein product [Lota lota]
MRLGDWQLEGGWDQIRPGVRWFHGEGDDDGCDDYRLITQGSCHTHQSPSAGKDTAEANEWFTGQFGAGS